MAEDIGQTTSNKNVKNQIRGLLDRKIHDDRPRVFPVVIGKIYKDNDKESVRWAEHQIRSLPNYSHVPLPDDFPTDLNPFRGKILVPMNHISTRLVTTLDRARANRVILVQAADHMERVNEAIFQGQTDKAISLLDDHFSTFGFSHILLRKVLFLASLGLSESLSDPLNVLLENIEINRRDTIRPSLADAYNRKRQYLAVVQNIMNISSGSVLTTFRKSIAQYAVRPICYDLIEFGDGLEAFANYSLLDAMYFISSHLNLSEDIGFLDEFREIWSDLDPEIRHSFTSDEFDSEALSNLYEKTESAFEEDADMAYYRHLSAFVECPEATRLRALGDFYLSYEPETSTEPGFVSRIRCAHFGESVQWSDLTAVRKVAALPGSRYLPQKAGTLERTIAMAVFFAREEIPSTIKANELIHLMNVTTFADRVISQRALSKLKAIGDSEGDLLFSIIPLCLLSVNPENSKDEFRLRRILQDLVIRDFNSSYIEFMKWMLEQAFQVGSYLYSISTDEFLIQFYHLFNESSEAVECRAQLHDLLFETTGDRRFQDMAGSLRLSAKIAKAREELDDSRIYVDLNRFDTWLKDNKLEKILNLVRSGACQPEVLEEISISDVNSSQGNEAELLKSLGECYKEFCENRIFGIASYLGRRIRHGTLKGTLLQDLERSVEEKFGAFVKDDTCKDYFQSWKTDFEKYIKRIGSDFFHIRSSQKPKGMISPTISEGYKFQYLKKGSASIISAFGEYEDPDFFVRIVSEMCWQIASADLTNSHSVIAVCKANARLSSVPESVGLVLGAAQNDYVRHVNAKLDEKFNLVATWFNRPKITVPSVDLPTLLRVVHNEVSEEFTSYVAAKADDDETKIVLSGSAYHIVYDFLYVALKNAAEHGRPGGNVTIEVNAEFNKSLIKNLELVVRSEYKLGDSAIRAKQNIASCRLDALDSAYVEEGKSGLRKIMRLERDWAEVSAVSILPLKDEFVVEMGLVLGS